jgi:glycosyltransferase involved in cell wall biosynthesis
MEMQPGLASVVMPAYNAEKYIAQSIESMLAQSYSNWEFIIVNDGSKDTTADIAARYTDRRIRLIHQANGGEAAARNTALEHVNGEFIAFLDADDLYQPNHLAVTIDYLKVHVDHGAVYTNGYHINQTGSFLQPLSTRRRGPFQGRIFEEVVRAPDVFGPPGCVVLCSKIVFQNQLRFDTNISYGTDWDFLTQCADLAEFGYLNQFTYLYRVHQTNMTLYTSDQKRVIAWTRCRSKAIKMANFKTCSLDVRRAVFYDLLVELLNGHPGQQSVIIQWPEFTGLPAQAQAQLLRLMASKAIMTGNNYPCIKQWLDLSRKLSEADYRGAWLAWLYRANPWICQLLLRAKALLQPKASDTSPFVNLY